MAYQHMSIKLTKIKMPAITHEGSAYIKRVKGVCMRNNKITKLLESEPQTIFALFGNLLSVSVDRYEVTGRSKGSGKWNCYSSNYISLRRKIVKVAFFRCRIRKLYWQKVYWRGNEATKRLCHWWTCVICATGRGSLLWIIKTWTICASYFV